MDNLEVTRGKDADGSRIVSANMTLHFEQPVLHSEIIEEYGRIEGVTFIRET